MGSALLARCEWSIFGAAIVLVGRVEEPFMQTQKELSKIRRGIGER